MIDHSIHHLLTRSTVSNTHESSVMMEDSGASGSLEASAFVSGAGSAGSLETLASVSGAGSGASAERIFLQLFDLSDSALLLKSQLEGRRIHCAWLDHLIPFLVHLPLETQIQQLIK
jgi:hypothetical protein